MILAIDVGNAYITIGGYNGDERVFVVDTLSDVKHTKYQYMAEFKSLLELHNMPDCEISGAIIASVVPELTKVIADTAKNLWGITPLILGPGVKSGLNIRIENPSQLGADIVAGAVAASAHYPVPCIVCNMGTTTVMSVINAEGVFTGAVIAAGVGTTLDSFTRWTALLPHVTIEAPKNVIGKSTNQSVQSGLVYGAAAMIDGLVLRIEEELGTKAKVVATGKMCNTVIPYCNTEIDIYKYLILDGLKIIYDKNTQ